MPTVRQLALPCLAVILLIVAPLRAADLTKEDMDKLVAHLQADAELWLQGQEVPTAIDYQLRAVTYTSVNVNLLIDALKSPRKDPVNLYVANKLLRPLLRAKDEVVALAIPAVEEFRLKAGDYREPPVYDAGYLKALTQPAGPAPASTSAREPGSTASTGPALTPRQKEKLAKDRPVIYHNQQLYEFERAYARLLLFANTPKYDEQVVEWLRQMHGKGLGTFFDILDAIGDEAGQMSKDRSAWYYKAMLELLDTLRLQKKIYSQPGLVQLNAEGNSIIATEMGYPGIRLARAANLLASQARANAQRVPTSQEVDAGKLATQPAGGSGRPRSNRPGI